MFQDRSVTDHLEQLHHAAVFVRQYVTVLDILTGKINEAAAHLEVAGNHSLLLRIGLRIVGIRNARRNPERIPPDIRRRQFHRLFHRRRIEDLYDLEWVHVNMEGMRDAHRLVIDGPLLGGVEQHDLIDGLVLELLAVNIVLRRGSSGRPAGWVCSQIPSVVDFSSEPNCARINIRQEGWKWRVVALLRWELHGRVNRRARNIDVHDRAEFRVLKNVTAGRARRLDQQIEPVRRRQCDSLRAVGRIAEVFPRELNAVLRSLLEVHRLLFLRQRDELCIDESLDRCVDQTPQLNLARLHGYRWSVLAVDKHWRGSTGRPAEEVGSGGDLLDDHDLLLQLTVVKRLEFPVVSRGAVVGDDQSAGKTIKHVDRRRAVFVRVVPVRTRRLAHLEAGGRAVILWDLEAVGIRADVPLRPNTLTDGQLILWQ